MHKHIEILIHLLLNRDRRGRDFMVVGFPTTELPVQSVSITTKVVNSNTVLGEVYPIQHHVIKFISDLRQGGGFLRALRFPPRIKLIATI